MEQRRKEESRRMPILEELKWNYNRNLTRYYNGCNYLILHNEETEKWLPMLLEILNDMNVLLEEIQKTTLVSNEEILNGFKEL